MFGPAPSLLPGRSPSAFPFSTSYSSASAQTWLFTSLLTGYVRESLCRYVRWSAASPIPNIDIWNAEAIQGVRDPSTPDSLLTLLLHGKLSTPNGRPWPNVGCTQLLVCYTCLHDVCGKSYRQSTSSQTVKGINDNGFDPWFFEPRDIPDRACQGSLRPEHLPPVFISFYLCLLLCVPPPLRTPTFVHRRTCKQSSTGDIRSSHNWET